MASKLTEKQAAFVSYVTKGCKPVQAAELSRYAHPAVEAVRLMKLPHVREALFERREATLKGDLASLALHAMRDLVGEDTPAATRYQASKWVLEHAGHKISEESEGSSKPLDEMDADELAAAIQGGMSALTELAGQLSGHHVIDGEVRQLVELVDDNDSQQGADFLE